MNQSANNNHHAPGIALGRQMTVEFYDCSSAVLADADLMEKVFLNAAAESGAHVVNSVFHSFEPQGVSGVVVISESHFAVHAWPEHDYAAVDLFTCGDGVDFDMAVKSLASGLKSAYWIVSSLVNRGILGEPGVERLVPVVENSKSHGLQLSWRDRFRHTGARAMSSAIDIYGCDTDKIACGTTLADFAGKVAAMLSGNTVSGNWHVNNQAQELEFTYTFERGRLNGFVDMANGTLYLDIFANGFFDPRLVAEFAIAELHGQYYRMQPQIRQ